MTELLEMKKSKWKGLYLKYGGKKAVKTGVKAVNKGATALDDYTPGWINKIALETLDLGDSYSCVCGQVFAGRARWELPAIFGSFDESYGFDSLTDQGNVIVDYDLLDFLWSNLIEYRLASQNDLLYAETFGKKPKVIA